MECGYGAMIHEHPDQYLWQYRRFNTRPEESYLLPTKTKKKKKKKKKAGNDTRDKEYECKGTLFVISAPSGAWKD